MAYECVKWFKQEVQMTDHATEKCVRICRIYCGARAITSNSNTPCPKISIPLLRTHLNQFVIHGFQGNIVHCTILTLLTITTLWHMHFTVCAQCNVIMTSKFVYIKLTFNTLISTKKSSSNIPTLK